MKAITQKQDKKWHDILPIDKDEKVLAIFSHHIIAYVAPFLFGLIVVVVIVGLALLTTTSTGIDGDSIIPAAYSNAVHMVAAVTSIVTLIFTFVPVWLRSQEHIVLTDEAVLQVLQPGLFAAKVSQTSLERLADVSVRENFFGTMFGYGTLTIETPGEQDNYEYLYLPDARAAARQIIEAQESYMIALEGGHLHPESYHQNKSPKTTTQDPQQIVVDPAQYQAFLEYQKEQAAKQQKSN